MSTSKESPASPSSSVTAALPGIGVCLLGAVAAMLVDVLIRKTTGFSSPILWAIVLGIAVGNVARLPSIADKGIAFSSKHILRIGIVLLGLEISLRTIADLGLGAIATIVAIVLAGMLATYAGARLTGFRHEHALLIGAGCSICGAAAISAMEGVLPKRKQEEFASAIAVIVVLGTLMIFLGPAITHALGWGDEQSGIFIGGATHEVGQVVAAGGIAGAAVLPIAVTVKLGRVLMLAPVVTLVGWRERTTGGAHARSLIPGFILGFLIAVLLRTFLPLPSLLLTTSTELRGWLFAIAMFALGTTVTLPALRRSGARPFLFGAGVSIVVALVASIGAAAV